MRRAGRGVFTRAKCSIRCLLLEKDMPSYRGILGHKNQTLLLSMSLLAIPATTGDARDLVIPAGCLLGLKISPDMDLNPNALGAIGRLGFVDEYAAMVPHRDKISHTPFASTIIRFVLVFGIPWFVLWLVRFAPPWWATLRLFAGLALADTLHVLTDYTLTWIKKRLSRFKTRRRRYK